MSIPPFRPLPLLGNPHVQTLLGSFGRTAINGRRARLRFVPLPDGDAMAIHISTPHGWREGDPIALLVHGLGGCHQSGYIARMVYRLVQRGIMAIAVDLRGAGAGARMASRLYNAACSEDIRAVAEACATWHPNSPLALVGFSLGGNIVLKLAGEAAGRPVSNLTQVATVAPPIDLARCSAMLNDLPFYDRFFVRHLLAQVARTEQLNPRLERCTFPARMAVKDFDDIYTAPRGSFADADDYYCRASSFPLIPSIQVPTLILTARDDPFICVAPFDALTSRPGLEIRITPSGGHLGFIGCDGAGGVRWAERFVVEWICSNWLLPSSMSEG